MVKLLTQNGKLVKKDGKLVTVDPPDVEDCECCIPCPDYTADITYERDCCCFTFHVDTTPTTSIIAYDWDFGDGTAHSIASDPVHCYTATGDYDVTVEITDSAGCKKIVNETVSCVCDADAVVADFTYEQTGDGDPCCYNFFGEGISNCDRSIASYFWTFQGGSTSSLQNPTKCFGAGLDGPFSVTLQVTDVFGCTDSVNMSVPCGVPTNCCDGFAPLTATATLQGWTDGVNCDLCAAEINTTHTLDKIDPAFGQCTWRKTFTIDCANPVTVSIRLTLTHDFGGAPTVHLEVTTNIFAGFAQRIFVASRANENCTGSWTFTLDDSNFSGSGGECGYIDNTQSASIP